ncbi:MAG: hypothetical protein R3B45_05455 [Bdellovibrionota bacterium]
MIDTLSELHIHLYGCLSAEDVWCLGKDCWQQKTNELSWYEDEYEKAWGRRPDSKQYWQDSTAGFEKLRKDFIFDQKAPFNCFQACFNLMIALFKITPDKNDIFKVVMHRHRDLGLRYVEYRTVMPAWFNKKQLDQYFTMQTRDVALMNQQSGNQFEAKIAYSLQRDNITAVNQYKLLREWINTNPELGKNICAIDFSYFEEGFPPSEKKDLFNQVRADNLANPEHPLAILYHVGESFQALSIESAARWVWQAFDAGAHRLGHAIALGVSPQIRAQKTSTDIQIQEPIKERIAHLSWLLEKEVFLKQHDFEFDRKQIQKELNELKQQNQSKSLSCNFLNHIEIERCKKFQDALMKDLSLKGAIIESCPSSNFRIGMIDNPDHHPLKRFIQQKIDVCISTDDPGIFAIDLEGELDLCISQLGLSKKDILCILEKTPNYYSTVLAHTFQRL